MLYTFDDKNRIRIRTFSGIATFLTMLAIFLFSAQNGDESSAISNGLLNMLLNTFFPDLLPEQYDFASFFIRKLAHFSIYTVLAVFMSIFSCTFKANFLCRLSIVTLSGFLYAATDEIHQLFSSGRAGSIRDVLLDTSGVIIGAFFTLLIIHHFLKKKQSAKE